MVPLISICIPAYERTENLRRLLDSILAQDFKDYVVIITHDSRTSRVQELVEEYISQLPLKYGKNEKQYNTPANWNLAISKASGEWIKLMHDDYWFASASSLKKFAEATAMKKVQYKPWIEKIRYYYYHPGELNGMDLNITATVHFPCMRHLI